MEENKQNVISSILLTVLSVIYIIIIRTVDVRSIGPQNTSVGLSSINELFKNSLGSNMTIYKITELLGIIAIGIAGIYALVGLVQLIKRKSLLKVDKQIISLAVLYILVIITYILFEKFIINYRPIIIDNELEASFPSSHTMMAICICMSAITMNKNYIKNKSYLKIANIVCSILMILIVVGRLVSGVHWLTDIIGGLIISATLLSYFYTLYNWGRD